MKDYARGKKKLRTPSGFSNGVYKAILKRRTIRRYSQKRIPYRTLKKLVNAARLAPSAANLQPCEFIIVDDKNMAREVFSALRWAAYIAPAGNPPPGEQPAAYIVGLINRERRSKGGIEDASAAAENILLAATGEGIGTCWLESIDRKKIRSILTIPRNCAIQFIIAIGYPRERSIVEEVKESIKYWKDKEGFLHVPKRKLQDILHRNKYG